MPLHRGDSEAPDDEGGGGGLAVNPFYGEANPAAGMTEARPGTGCPMLPCRRPRRTSWSTTS